MAQKDDKDYIIDGLKGLSNGLKNLGLKNLSKKIKNIKLAQWAVIVASLVAGYFVYQDYADKKSEAEFCEMVFSRDNFNYIRNKPHLVKTCARHWGGR